MNGLVTFLFGTDIAVANGISNYWALLNSGTMDSLFEFAKIGIIGVGICTFLDANKRGGKYVSKAKRQGY